MVLPGHLAAGYLVTYAVLNAGGFHLSGNEVVWLTAIGTLLGDAPDSDLTLNFFKKKTLSPAGTAGHRDHITHTAIVWLVCGLVVSALGFVFTNQFVEVLGILLWLCPWSHLVCDSFVFGVRWLWPFSNKNYALTSGDRKTFTKWTDLFKNYFKMPLSWLEIGLTVLALVVFLKSVL